MVSRITDDERRDRLRLARSENVGPITYAGLMRRYGSAAAALEALPALARRGGRGRPIKLHDRSAAERELAALTKRGGHMLACGEPDYPIALAAIPDPPPLIAVLGSPALLGREAVAIVGARNASANGVRFASRLAGELGEAGLVVVSGLARGIDTAAHKGALRTGTAAVLAGGVDVVYPKENQPLYDDILAQGAALSEVPLGTEPQARHFPRRNRIIAGLSRGVVVVEAARRSGSLITARLALEQGREVFAVPGSPLDPRSHGANHLIRQGATLVEGADDVLRVLAESQPKALADSPPEDSYDAENAAIAGNITEELRSEIAKLLGPSAVPVDELIRQSQLTPAVVLTILLELELAGRLERHPGNQVSLIISNI